MTQIEGVGSSGLAPLALLSRYGTCDRFGVTAFCTKAVAPRCVPIRSAGKLQAACFINYSHDKITALDDPKWNHKKLMNLTTSAVTGTPRASGGENPATTRL